MYLKKLSLTNFRSYQELSLEFQPGLTIFTGDNAQGKTNILEAIYLLSVAKSHRTNRDREMIHLERDYAKIEAEVATKSFDFNLEIVLNNRGKIAKFNHIEQPKLSHFIGKMHAIMFAPEDMQLIKGSPSLRRRFIDVELGQASPIYLSELLDYNRILKQRNAYLREFGRSSIFDQIYFDILTEQLIEKSLIIIENRVKFVIALEELAIPIHRDLSNQRDDLSVEYIPNSKRLDYTQLETLKDQFYVLFSESLEQEKNRRTTLYGPHRDDLKLSINGQEAQQFGSQGQQRTIVLSLKLAETELIYQLTNEYPILLLDDVLSELDDDRQHILMNHIKDKVQTILTTATIEGLKVHQMEHAEIYEVTKGFVTNLNEKKGS